MTVNITCRFPWQFRRSKQLRVSEEESRSRAIEQSPYTFRLVRSKATVNTPVPCQSNLNGRWPFLIPSSASSVIRNSHTEQNPEQTTLRKSTRPGPSTETDHASLVRTQTRGPSWHQSAHRIPPQTQLEARVVVDVTYSSTVLM